MKRAKQTLSVILAVGLVFLTASDAYASQSQNRASHALQGAALPSSEGPSNVIFGTGAGVSVTNAVQSVFVGVNAGASNTSAINNTFVGYSAGSTDTIGSENTLIGSKAGPSTSGFGNTFVGYTAGFANASGYQNTYIGDGACGSATGVNNTCVGNGTGGGNTTGSYNTFLGEHTGTGNNGSGNVFLGSDAGSSSTGSNRLFIDVSNTSSPLVYGEFDNRIAAINGKLGIGTMAPAAALHVLNPSGGVSEFLESVQSGHAYRAVLGEGSAGFAVATAVDGVSAGIPFRIFNGAPDNALAIAANGSVGAGTTTPLTQFQVGAGTLAPITSGASLMMQPGSNNPAPSGGVSMVMKSNTTGAEMFLYADQNNGLMGTATTTPFGLRSDNHTRLWVAANGNIGIGEFLANPTARLQFDTGANSDGVTWNNASSRSLKTNFAAADSKSVLEKLAALPMQTWNYKVDPTTLHLGPTAEDFRAAFGLGNSDSSISTVDEGGVALAAIQGLNQELRQKEAVITQQGKRLEELEARLSAVEHAAPVTSSSSHSDWPRNFGLAVVTISLAVVTCVVLMRNRGRR